ncbi:copper amine oxidase N-terminal domain-containing protein [Cohnella sp. GbtcB17]|uniref:copper amine oxidase N-terminal domain-containing protein n=1 Tax=Cohnella sp. GbtcB17 TaxID=2824762 RepID=UPI0027D1FE89|nr:copper amine oxidase N-terminal domain-containing protein [Cohnella sp. GbtcB17]
MMKMKWTAILSCVLAASLMSGTAAFAKSAEQHGNKGGNSAAVKTQVEEKKNESNGHDKKESASSATYGNSESVTSATYGGPNGYKGLLHAIENVKDKPAGPVLANLLLTKYEMKLTDQQKAELEAIQEQDKALSAIADLLDQKGSVVDAVYVQKEAIKANAKNLASYQKLGKLYKKSGKTGVNLFVNGDETIPAVAPIIRDGSTLVPFRAIAEALKAEVIYNAADRTVTVTRDGTSVKLVLNSKTAYVNGKTVKLDVTATVVKGSTVVPVRFVSEALDSTVKWEPVSQSVVIYDNP